MDKETRRKMIIRRRIFIAICVTVLILIGIFFGLIIKALNSKPFNDENSDYFSSQEIDSSKDDISSQNSGSSSDLGSSSEIDTSSQIQSNSNNTNSSAELDPDFEILLLVNPWNPLPENYNIESNLVEIDKSLRNNNYVYKIHKDVYPYMKAMVEAAHRDGVDLRVWSPYRSYAIQKDLFSNKVARVKNSNPTLTQAQAEAEAATVVARPGTSEHQTGLAADFNMASSKFDNTEYYRWMLENAEDYGFIQRYTAKKQDKTGIIPESWHWRFVGINTAKEINKLDMCLEEYLEYKKVDINRN